MKTRNSRSLTEDNVGKLLVDLTMPMILGILGMVAFNLADTYFVGKLGTGQMAALTFTFPVILVLNSINHGLGIGASSVISKAVGEKNREKVMRLSTDALTLGLIFAIIAAVIGELTIGPLFKLLGADASTMPHITTYMRIWYAGVPFIVIPMIGNNVIRALGDTKTPSIVMMVSAFANIILDPILIFGLGPFPELNVAGAAIATVIARGLTFGFALYVLIVREKVVTLDFVKLKTVLESWKTILYIGLPNAIAKMIVPIGAGIITGMIASYGTETVAGFGIATRVEYFALTIAMALSSVIPVFVGQNFGAKRIDRIIEGVVKSERFSIVSGIVIYLLLVVLARPLSYLFTSDKAVSDTVVFYLRIVPLGYGVQGILLILNGAFNALHRPLEASAINLVQMLVVYVPLAMATSKAFGIAGIFVSLVVSYLVVGLPAHILFKKKVQGLAHKESLKPIMEGIS